MLEIWKYVECFINKSRKMVMLPANLYIYIRLFHSFLCLSNFYLFTFWRKTYYFINKVNIAFPRCKPIPTTKISIQDRHWYLQVISYSVKTKLCF